MWKDEIKELTKGEEAFLLKQTKKGNKTNKLKRSTLLCEIAIANSIISFKGNFKHFTHSYPSIAYTSILTPRLIFFLYSIPPNEQ